MNYARAIKTVRAMRGLSQQDLAQRMEVDEAFLSRLGKAGASPPSGRTLERLAEALQIPMYLLILLASDEADLKSMSKTQAEMLGQQLIQMLATTESKTGTATKPRRRKRKKS